MMYSNYQLLQAYTEPKNTHVTAFATCCVFAIAFSFLGMETSFINSLMVSFGLSGVVVFGLQRVVVFDQPIHSLTPIIFCIPLVLLYFSAGPATVLYPCFFLIWLAIFRHDDYKKLLLSHCLISSLLLLIKQWPAGETLLTLLLLCVFYVSAHIIIFHRLRFEEQMMRCSLYDPLTGLANRRAFDSYLRRLTDSVDRGVISTYSLLLIDIDLFKKVNDTYGHSIGDEVLVHVAKVIENAVRDLDSVFRIGGEELCVLLPSTPNEELRFVAERIRKQIQIKPLEHSVNLSVSVTVSIGGATYCPDGSVFDQADSNLYHSKENGRNRVTV